MKTLLINAARCSSAVLLSAAVLLGAVSCGPKSTTHRNPEGLVSVNYADLKQGEDILISEWVGEPEFIALESRPEALVTDGLLTISDQYIGVYRKNSETTPFKLFDRATGKYLRDIGGIGRGPGEYTGISSAQIDEAGGKVWISTIDRHNIYGYDIASGRLVADIKLTAIPALSPSYRCPLRTNVPQPHGARTWMATSCGRSPRPTLWRRMSY